LIEGCERHARRFSRKIVIDRPLVAVSLTDFPPAEAISFSASFAAGIPAATDRDDLPRRMMWQTSAGSTVATLLKNDVRR
jgi:hypothetical protein